MGYSRAECLQYIVSSSSGNEVNDKTDSSVRWLILDLSNIIDWSLTNNSIIFWMMIVNKCQMKNFKRGAKKLNIWTKNKCVPTTHFHMRWLLLFLESIKSETRDSIFHSLRFKFFIWHLHLTRCQDFNDQISSKLKT